MSKLFKHFHILNVCIQSICVLRLNKPTYRTLTLFKNALETIFMNKPTYELTFTDNYFTIGYITDTLTNKRFFFVFNFYSDLTFLFHKLDAI